MASNDGDSSPFDGEGVNLPENEESSLNLIEQQPRVFPDDARNAAIDIPAAVDVLSFAMQVPVPPAMRSAVSITDPNLNIAGLDAMHSSIFHALQYQHMLNYMRMIAQYSIPQQSMFDNSAADPNIQAAAAANINHLPNFGYPPFPPQPAAAPAEFSLGQFTTLFDPIQDPDPELQEHDYDNNEEQRKPYGQRCLLYLVEERHWVEALQRISTHPHEASTIGIQGRAPLHLACDHDAPAFLVHALLCVWPRGAFMVGTSYMNPLHITCSSQHASNEIVNLLLSGCGDPLRITGAKDVDGDTPLHAACRCAAPIDVLATLLQTNSDVVMWYDYEGLNPLLRLWVRYYVMLGEDVIADIKSANDLTPELVEAWQKSLLLLRVMNEVHKKSGQVSGDRQGPVPFHAVHCASAVECPRCVLRIATCLYPDQLLITDEKDMLPLHIATIAPIYRVHDLGGEGFANDIFDYEEVDRRHHAIQEGENIYHNKKEEDFPENPLNEPSVIDILLDAAPEAAKIRDPTGRLPLHSAIGHGKAYDQGVQGLIEAYPQALEVPDTETQLYPFMLAGTAGKSKKNCSTIFELMRMSPDLVKLGISDSDVDSKPKAEVRSK